MSFLYKMDETLGQFVFGFYRRRCCVQWFLFAVTALSCLCAALYCMAAVEQLSLPEMQLSRACLVG